MPDKRRTHMPVATTVQSRHEPARQLKARNRRTATQRLRRMAKVELATQRGTTLDPMSEIDANPEIITMGGRVVLTREKFWTCCGNYARPTLTSWLCFQS